MTQSVEFLVCAAPGKLLVESRPAPVAGPGEALVRPRRVGICGTDFHIFEGKHPFLQYPRVMGHELAVEVLQTPPESAFAAGEICVVNPYLSCGHCVACRKGKPNCCVSISVLGVHQDGGMAGLLAVPVDNLVRAPGLSVEQCATVEFLAIGAHAVRRGSVTGNDRVLVVGAGPIGIGVAIFAGIAGGNVTLLDQDADRAAASAALARANVLAPASDPVAAALGATDGEGFDVVFDATGNARAMEAGFAYVAHGGRYVLVSIVKDSISFADPLFHSREMTLFGSRNATQQDFEHVISAIRDGRVPVDRIVTHRTTLAGAVTDLPRWTHDKGGLIKAMISID